MFGPAPLPWGEGNVLKLAELCPECPVYPIFDVCERGPFQGVTGEQCILTVIP